MPRPHAPRPGCGERPAGPCGAGEERRADRLAAALEAGGLGVWDADLTTGDVALSTQACMLLGLPVAERTPPRALLRRLRREDRHRLWDVFRQARRSPDPVEIDERLRTVEEGVDSRWVAVRGRATDDGAIGVVRDVTEREELLRQKDALMVELNHRTKNSLQLVASLLRLESRDVRDPEGRRRFVEASTRVNSIAAVHEGLDRTADLKRVHLVPLLRRLCEDLVHLRSREDEIRLDLSADVAIETDRAIPLAIIVNELVTNALTYGRRNGEPARVAVAMTEAAAGELDLLVRDDGPGLPADFTLDRPPGLGLQLTKALARQIGGRLELDAAATGTAFRMSFPVER